MTTTPRLADRHGSGLALLAVHGLGVDHRIMTPLLEPLFGEGAEDAGSAREVERFYLDLPGHGAASGEDARTAAEVTDVLDRWVAEELGDRPFVIVAQSLGGQVARELVGRRPAQACGMALIAPLVEGEEDERRLPERTVLERDDAFLATLGDKERKVFTTMSVVQTRAQYELFARDHLPGVRAADGEVMAELKGDGSAGREDGPERWEAPVLVVCGRQDDRVGWRDQVDLLAHYPRATYAVLDGAGHNVHLERGGAVRVLLGDWVDACLTRSRG